MEKSDSKIEVTLVTKENIKEGMQVRIAPSVDIMRIIVDAIAANGISGVVNKGKDDTLFVTAGVSLVANANELLEHEQVFEEFEKHESEETKKHESA